MSRTFSYIPIEPEFLNKENPPSRQQMTTKTKIFKECKCLKKCDKCCESCLLSASNKELRYVLIDK